MSFLILKNNFYRLQNISFFLFDLNLKYFNTFQNLKKLILSIFNYPKKSRLTSPKQ